jgi:hypothetical protein
MADTTMGAPGTAARPGLFLRNATGLVKSWSTFDAFIYSFWSINLITLGLYGMSFVYTVPDGQLLAGILLFGVLVTFLVITYAMLVSVMPRTGGDYAWQSRVLGGGLGFVLSITGWWFTLFLWAPIYANILVVQFFSPLAYTLGWTGVATFFTSQTGIFVSCLIVLAFVSIVVTLGMETYARIQKACFWIGLVGLAVVCALLLFASPQDFQNAFNREATSLFGAPANAYQGTIDAASKTFAGSSFGTFSFGPVLLLLPWLAFYLLWPNWGATLYGEVRGAKDIRKPFWSMFAGLWVTVAMVAVVVILINKTIGWNFYQSANAAYWNNLFAAQGAVAPPVPIWPYPVMFAGFLVDNHLGEAPRALRRVDPDDRAVARDQRDLRLQAGLHERVPGRHRDPCPDVPCDHGRRDHPALAAQGPLRRLADRPVQDRRGADDHGRRCDHRIIPALHALPVVVQHRQPLWDVAAEDAQLGHLLRRDLCRRDRHLRGRPSRAEEPGNRPGPHPPRDSG